MARFYQFKKLTKNGWTHWVTPRMSGYKMACCDCGLVHDLQFNAVVVRKKRGGGFEYETLSRKKYRIELRARRNNRSTAAMRRNWPQEK